MMATISVRALLRLHTRPCILRITRSKTHYGISQQGAKIEDLAQTKEVEVMDNYQGSTEQLKRRKEPPAPPLKSPKTLSLDADQKDVDENVKKFREGKFSQNITDPTNVQHWRQRAPPAATVAKGGDVPPMGVYAMNHPIWSKEETEGVRITHKPPEGFVDKAAYNTIQTIRMGFDVFSGYSFGETNEKKWLTRIIFLETVAAVPGMVAAMVRHLRSLARMRRDHGWIHTLLEEAENERMHLMTALTLRQPSTLFRIAVVGTQGFFVSMFGITYLISPRFCHRMVGYLEEEAVKTYTKCIEDIDKGNMTHWKKTHAPDVAIRYWKLEPDATMRDVIMAIRADEAHHRIVNHTLASLKPSDFNPYKPGN